MPQQPPLRVYQLILDDKQTEKYMKAVDGRTLWLQESIVNASTFTAAINMVETKRELSRKETDMKNVALAFMYLYNVVEEKGMLDDIESFFTQETIH